MVSCRPEKITSNPFCLAVTWFILAGFASQTRGDDTNHFARWEKDIAAFAKSDNEKPSPKNGMVFVGSSSIRLWDLKKSFPAMPVINRGFGGSQLIASDVRVICATNREPEKAVADNESAKARLTESIYVYVRMVAMALWPVRWMKRRVTTLSRPRIGNVRL